VPTPTAKLLQRELDARARGAARESDRACRAHTRALRSRRKIAVEHTEAGTVVTIRARSEGCSVLLSLCVGALGLGGAVALLLAILDTTAALAFVGATWPAAAVVGALAGLAGYRWPLRVLLTRDAYVIYRRRPDRPRRVGPRHELSIHNADWHGPRLRVSVKRRFCYEFWGLDNPLDRATIDALRTTGDI